ncbi:hypothetical protein BHE74_00038544 [Ensete ventricosum]|nr:hypothetical protein GW17_00044909 [Ensete ventricosum]RWW54848.1 hypothetical protein BHE74_00038544 [Ensete ventricosum]RZR96675.1 hypothetical protein BHM03_00025725 [Ensete ventricosum]
MADRLTRIAIVSSDRCKPKKCRQECKKSCPVVKTGILLRSSTFVERDSFLKFGTLIFDASFRCFSTFLPLQNPPDWQEILTYFRGSELQNYFTRILEDNLKVLRSVARSPDSISFSLFTAIGIKAEYSYLSLLSYVIVVEHDLSVLDYLSDFICCLYGKPGAYGVVTLPFSVREGINIFLAGFVPTENLRFRDESLTFKVECYPADIYLIDEPSAYLDSEQRIVASKVIKRFILHAKKTAFVVEHDFIMATYLADKVIVYEGRASVDCTANAPQSLVSGMNLFLSVLVEQMILNAMYFFVSLPKSCSRLLRKFCLSALQHLDITFRRDPTNYRPRINKLESTKDREQKAAGSYYYLDD